MLTTARLRIALSVALALASIVAGSVCALAQPSPEGEQQNLREASVPVTVQGTVQFEGASNHSGIKVEIWREGNRSGFLGGATTDVSGSYLFTDVDSAYSYAIVAGATIDGYAADSAWVVSSTLGTSEGVYTVSPLRLLRQKRFALDWVFQADGSPGFISGSPASGTVRLRSATTKWTAPTTFVSTGLDSGFCFSAASTTDCQDFYVGNTRRYPLALWANNGQGGIHDIGPMELDALTEAPDKSNGVGYRQFYDSQNTPAIVGHVYAVVTQDGGHYAKFRVTGIAEATSVQLFLPLVVR